MRFEWDKDKSEANRLKHGISFSEATILFRSDHITLELSGVTGEKRWLIIACIDKKFYSGIFTQRKGKFRIISVRRSRKEEEKYYEKYF